MKILIVFYSGTKEVVTVVMDLWVDIDDVSGYAFAVAIWYGRRQKVTFRMTTLDRHLN